MGHNIEKFGGKMKKTTGKLTGNKKLEMKGLYQENKAKAKDKFDFIS